MMLSSAFVASAHVVGRTSFSPASSSICKRPPLRIYPPRRGGASTPHRRPRRAHCCADDGGSAASTATPISSLTWAVGQSTEYSVVNAVREAVARASTTLVREGVLADVVFVFVKSRSENTPDNQIRRVMSVLKKMLAMRRVLKSDTLVFGSTSASYLDSDDDATASIALVHFPEGAVIKPFIVPDEDAFDIDWKQDDWHDLIGMKPPVSKPSSSAREASAGSPVDSMQILLLQHPEFDRMRDLLSGLDFAYPGVRKFGAIAGRTHPLHTAYLLTPTGTVTSGVAGLAMRSADVQVDVTVAQGARGVGPLLEVTQVREGNEICRVREIGTPGRAEAGPMTLFDMWAHTDLISMEDRILARKYLLFGVEVEKVADFAASSAAGGRQKDGEERVGGGKGEAVDMAIRKVLAFNEATKSLVVEGGDVRLGSRVRFQIRDEEAARSELLSLFNKLRLEGASRAMEGMSMMGGLLMVDTERGENLYGNVTPDLDRALFCERFPVPLAVMSSEGQIGPLPAGGLLGVAGNTFTLSASALYLTFYGRTGPPQVETQEELR